jgi:hypothetical protein
MTPPKPGRGFFVALLLGVSGSGLAQDDLEDFFATDGTTEEETPRALAGEPGRENTESPDVERLLLDAPADAGVAGNAATEADFTGDSAEIEDFLSGGTEPDATEQAASNVTLSGFVQNELAYTWPDDSHLSKFKNVAKIRLNGRLTDKVSFQLGGHLQYDPVYEFETYYPDIVEDDQKLWGYVDETYLDIDAGAWELRLGRQHIIWGEMVGLFFADVVSALDLREFVLPDFDLIRIPQWAARAEYFGDDFKAELVYIPYMTVDNLGRQGAEFFSFPATLPPGLTAEFREDKTPNDPVEDFGAGARGSWLVDGWDFSLFYYTSPDKTAAYARSLVPGAAGLAPSLVFQPVHERIHQTGGTVAKELGGLVFKAEAVQTFGRRISTTAPGDLDGLVDTDELRYVAGLDWAGETGHRINVQFFQTWLQDPAPGMIFNDVESGASVLLTTEALHPNITPEVLWIRSLDRDEWLLETKVSWEFATDWRAVLGTDVFGGPPNRLLGQFDNSDRVYWEFRHSF